MKRVILAASLALSVAGCAGMVVGTGAFPEASDEPSPVMHYYSLPRMVYPLEIKCSKETLTVTLGKAMYLPDDKYRFRIVYRHNEFSNDTITIKTDSSGLLAAVNADAEYQTSAIAGKAVELVRMFTGTGIEAFDGAAPTPTPGGPTRPCVGEAKYDETILIDPSETADSQAGQLASIRTTYGVAIRVAGAEVGPRPHVLPANVSCSARRSESETPRLRCVSNEIVADGIYYRPAAAYDLTVRVCTKIASAECDGDPRSIRRHRLIAPDPTRVFYIPFDRKMFAKFDVKLTFDHGMLTTFQSTDTSEFLAALQVPGDVIRSILGLSTSSSTSAVAKPSAPRPAGAPAGAGAPASGEDAADDGGGGDEEGGEDGE